MSRCSYCNHFVSHDAKLCPSCGKRDPSSGYGAGYLLLLGLLVLAFLLPALLLNHLLGRFSDALIEGTMSDTSSWVFSLVIWGLLASYYWANKK
jgi:hypothetical protein